MAWTAYECEFSRKARAKNTTQDADITASIIKGNTGIGKIGAKFSISGPNAEASMRASWQKIIELTWDF
ncbi:MAG: hypothetical protein ACTTIV_06530 [Campylobacter sp.]